MPQGASHPTGEIQRFFGSIAQRYDLANHLLSGGFDFLWRRSTAAAVARHRPKLVLDLATGSGDLSRTLAQFLSKATIVGADFCEPMLQIARKKGISNLVVADALQLPFGDETFSAVTVAFGLRNMSSWPAALAEMRRVLMPGGRVYILDFSLPGPLLRGAYRFYLHRVLPRLAGVISGQRDAYEYLAESIERFSSGEAMRPIFAEAGLRLEAWHSWTGGIVTLHIGQR